LLILKAERRMQMNCSKCGTEIPDDAQTCRACGADLRLVATAAQGMGPKTSGLAIAAFVLGILCIPTLFLTAMPAIILGIIALVLIQQSRGKQKGRGFAIAGIVIPIFLLPLVLMVILMPALNRAKNQAKSVMCMSNLHQWSLVWKMYTDDNGGEFPQDTNWVEYLRAYYHDEKMLLCPTAIKTENEGGQSPFAAWREDDTKGSYGLNYWVTQSAEGIRTEEKLWKTPNVRGSTDIPMMLDCSSLGVSPEYSDIPPEYDGQPRPPDEAANQMRDCCINRHNKVINAAFLDYSVRRVGLKELWQLKWHRDWNSEGNPPPEWPEWMRSFKDYDDYRMR